MELPTFPDAAAATDSYILPAEPTLANRQQRMGLLL